ncbi:Aste57867_23568 [Aphanomyces stellatus]|uniref:Aste57867_23568 protein n=1 Tax=Aphanomyces stellatus TaxID=120398 RepID=A0A485LPW9_9STRA|nr:hypothetical protein As57867_023497 [Aphanomyces stellatus]VFU00213.1 Aste57867_23568 [Aphanomyces stellatus]
MARRPVSHKEERARRRANREVTPLATDTVHEADPNHPDCSVEPEDVEYFMHAELDFAPSLPAGGATLDVVGPCDESVGHDQDRVGDFSTRQRDVPFLRVQPQPGETMLEYVTLFVARLLGRFEVDDTELRDGSPRTFLEVRDRIRHASRQAISGLTVRSILVAGDREVLHVPGFNRAIGMMLVESSLIGIGFMDRVGRQWGDLSVCSAARMGVLRSEPFQLAQRIRIVTGYVHSH